jgi:hypothetical protein
LRYGVDEINAIVETKKSSRRRRTLFSHRKTAIRVSRRIDGLCVIREEESSCSVGVESNHRQLLALVTCCSLQAAACKQQPKRFSTMTPQASVQFDNHREMAIVAHLVSNPCTSKDRWSAAFRSCVGSCDSPAFGYLQTSGVLVFSGAGATLAAWC